jgi:PTS system beta-glucosides-specific IIC component
MFCSNLSQGSASLAVSLKSKDKNLKQISLGAGISALVAGVTEPALYGVTLKLRTPLRAACIAAAVGGLYAGLTGVVAYTLGGSPSAISLVTMIGGNGYTTLVNGVITLVIVFLLSFLLTLLFFKDQPSHTVKTAPENQISQVQEFAGQSVSSDNTQAAEAENGSGKEETIFSPLCGQVVPLSSLSDVTFSSGVLGKGCAIVPYKGRVLAPFKGRVENIVNTKHALALCSDLGTELLIHIGQDTVALDGKYFTSYCQTGDRFQVGDLLLEFDLESIQKEGYDLTTPIVIVNREDQKIGVLCDQKIQVGDPLLCLLSSSVPNETKAINTKETDKP